MSGSKKLTDEQKDLIKLVKTYDKSVQLSEKETEALVQMEQIDDLRLLGDEELNILDKLNKLQSVDEYNTLTEEDKKVIEMLRKYEKHGILSNTESLVLTNIDELEKRKQEIDNAAEGVATIKELQLLDDGALQKLTELEQKILWREFYFPGGEPTLKVKGDDEYVLDTWDPRVIPEYIKEAKREGFHKHFLYYNGSIDKITSCSLKEAAQKLNVNVEAGGSKIHLKDGLDGATKSLVYGMIDGLIYMDKVETMLDEEECNFVSTNIYTLEVTGNEWTSKAREELVKLTKLSKEKFSEYGYQAHDMNYGFDLHELSKEWDKAKADYEKYKNKIWDILKNVKALQICTNNVDSTNVGDVNINQMINCTMEIDSKIKEESSKSNGRENEPSLIKPTVPEKKNDDIPKIEPSKTPDETNNTPKVEPSKVEPKVEPSKMIENPDNVPKVDSKTTEEDVNSKKKMTIIIISVSVSVVVLIGVVLATVLLIKKFRKKDVKKDIELDRLDGSSLRWMFMNRV